MRRLLRGRHRARLAAASLAAACWPWLLLRRAAPAAAAARGTRVVGAHHLAHRPQRPAGAVRIVRARDHGRRRASRPSASTSTTSCWPPTPTARPYAVEWTDENPFEARRIRVEMTDGEPVRRGPRGSEAVRGRRGRRGAERRRGRLGARRQGALPGAADRRPTSASSRTTPRRRSTRCMSEAVPTTFALLVDSSQSMARNIEFVRQSVLTLPGAAARRRTWRSWRRSAAPSPPSPGRPATPPRWPTR